MAARRSSNNPIIQVLVVLFLIVSCACMRGAGIMPPLEDGGYNQWSVLNTEFLTLRTNNGQDVRQWRIVARFTPEEAAAGLRPLDISATIDNVQIPFTFEEDDQIFESVTSFALSQGSHRFQLAPTENPSQPFPTLIVTFEAP